MTVSRPNIEQPHEALLSKPQVARRLGVHVRTVDNLMMSKSISFIRIGRAVRFEPAAIDAYKIAHRTNAA